MVTESAISGLLNVLPDRWRPSCLLHLIFPQVSSQLQHLLTKQDQVLGSVVTGTVLPLGSSNHRSHTLDRVMWHPSVQCYMAYATSDHIFSCP